MVMVCQVFDVFVCFDIQQVRDVIWVDFEVDIEFKLIIWQLIMYMMEDLCIIIILIDIIIIVWVIECIGDYVKNVLE